MTGDSSSEIVCVANVEMSGWILKNIDREHLKMAPAVGFEPTTNRLTADRSTTELRWIASLKIASGYFRARSVRGNLQSVNWPVDRRM